MAISINTAALAALGGVFALGLAACGERADQAVIEPATTTAEADFGYETTTTMPGDTMGTQGGAQGGAMGATTGGAGATGGTGDLPRVN